MNKRNIWGITAAIPLLFSASQTSAVPVDLELSLVIDVSGSVSSSEYDLMMDGYANAFRDITIQNNILSGDNGAIAVNTIFFASSAFTTALDSFSLLDSITSINTFADTLDNFVRPGSGGTDIHEGMAKALSLLIADNGFESSNLIMDISGDGTSTTSAVEAQRDAAETNDIVVNGITIGANSIFDFYTNNVITSDGFAIHATSFDTFGEGIKDKLKIETDDIPEPASITLIGLGLLGMFLRKRKAQLNIFC